MREDGSEGIREIEAKELMPSNQNGGGHRERGSDDSHSTADQDRGLERIDPLEDSEVSVEIVVFDGSVGGDGNTLKVGEDRKEREKGRERGELELNSPFLPCSRTIAQRNAELTDDNPPTSPPS